MLDNRRFDGRSRHRNVDFPRRKHGRDGHSRLDHHEIQEYIDRYLEIDPFVRLPEGLDLPAADRVGGSSDYFIADVVVEYGVAVSTLEALLVRTGERVNVLSLRSR